LIPYPGGGTRQWKPKGNWGYEWRGCLEKNGAGGVRGGGPEGGGGKYIKAGRLQQGGEVCTGNETKTGVVGWAEERWRRLWLSHWDRNAC